MKAGSLTPSEKMYYTTVFPALFWVDTKTETFILEPLYREEIEASTISQIFSQKMR